MTSYARSVGLVAGGITLLIAMAAFVFFASVPRPQSSDGRAREATPPDPVTFNRHIGPIIHSHCSVCHRPGGSGPFSLLTYEDVKRRARLVEEVTRVRFMPPWLPEPGDSPFADERRLTDTDIGMITQWVDQGTLEGDPKDLDPLPTWPDGWQLGKPDVVVEMPQSYTLPLEGADDFRNFVLPVSIPEDRYVRAVEFRPSNPRVVHHAVVLVDRARLSRVKDAEDPGPGFAGMDQSGDVGSPEGYFVSWTPGKIPFISPESMAWRLDRGADLVLMLHLVPTGKAEVVKAALGLYFSKSRPTREPVLVRLGSKTVDIPANVSDYVVEDEMSLPVDTELFGVYPHAHYLGKDLRATAILPNGTTRTLLHIKAWDFNWQDEYRYAPSLSLPRGTRIRMRFTYDNSSTNPRNPRMPPERVFWGPRSRDEMAYLWLQAAPRDAADLPRLRQAASVKKFYTDFTGFQHAVVIRPEDPQAHNNLGVALSMLRRPEAAAEHLELAAKLGPKYVAAQFNLGVLLLDRGDRLRAREQFARTLRLNPDHVGAHTNLGGLLLSENQLAAAAEHFERALAVRSDPDAHFNLGTVRMKQGRLRDAETHLAAALAAVPTDIKAKESLATVRHMLEQTQRR